MSKLGVSMPILNQPMEAFPGMAAAAEDALGLRQERLDVLDALMREGPGCLERLVDNKLVDALAIAGTPDECRRKLAEYEGRLPHIILHTPYVPPLTQEDSADAYHNIITTFGR